MCNLDSNDITGKFFFFLPYSFQLSIPKIVVLVFDTFYSERNTGIEISYQVSRIFGIVYCIFPIGFQIKDDEVSLYYILNNLVYLIDQKIGILLSIRFCKFGIADIHWEVIFYIKRNLLLCELQIQCQLHTSIENVPEVTTIRKRCWQGKPETRQLCL